MLVIRESKISDINRIVDVHLASFPGFFLTRMGPRFLEKYYSIVMDYKSGLVLVAYEADQAVGFVAGFRRPQEFYRFLSANRSKLIIPTILGLILRPDLIPRFFYNRKTVQDKRVGCDTGVCELSSIGVHPDFAGRGAGGLLLKAFLEKAQNGKSDLVILTTDAENNRSVNDFYSKNGFVLERVFDSGNHRKMNEYHFKLCQDNHE